MNQSKRLNRQSGVWRSIGKTIQKNKWFYLFLLPGFALMIIFNYLPLYGLIGAFENYSPFKGFLGSKWVGIANFKTLFALPDFSRVLWNTVRIGFWSFIVNFPAPILLALMINEIKNAAFKKTAQTISYIPNFISWVVVTGIFSTMLSANGVVNDVLQKLGLNEPIYFFGETDWFTILTVITSVWKNVGFGSILYLAVLTGINPQLYEAAQIDGASKWQQIRHITIPGLMPTISLMLVLNLSNILVVNFDQLYTMQNTMNLSVSDVMDTYIYRIAMTGSINDYSRGIAFGLFRAALCFLIFMIANRASRKLGAGAIV